MSAPSDGPNWPPTLPPFQAYGGPYGGAAFMAQPAPYTLPPLQHHPELAPPMHIVPYYAPPPAHQPPPPAHAPALPPPPQQQQHQAASPTGEGAEASPDRPKKSTVIACFFCKERKLRCDTAKPACGNCSARKVECAYPEFVRRRGPGKKKRARPEDDESAAEKAARLYLRPFAAQLAAAHARGEPLPAAPEFAGGLAAEGATAVAGDEPLPAETTPAKARKRREPASSPAKAPAKPAAKKRRVEKASDAEDDDGQDDDWEEDSSESYQDSDDDYSTKRKRAPASSPRRAQPRRSVKGGK